MSAKYVTLENGAIKKANANVSLASSSRSPKDQKETENRFKVHIYENYAPNIIVETSEDDDDESERVQINRCVPKTNAVSMIGDHTQNEEDNEFFNGADNFNTGYRQFFLRNRKQFTSISGGE